MQEPNLFEIFTSRIEKAGIRFFVGGSVAAIVYGEPRLTHDIDLILHLRSSDIDNLTSNFPSPEFYVPPKEVIINELNRETRGHFNIIHSKTGFKADIYLVGNESLQQFAFNNINEIEFLNNKLPVAPPEYIIIKKLEFFKEGNAQKHISDIEGILKESSDLIKFDVLNELLEIHDLKELYATYFLKSID